MTDWIEHTTDTCPVDPDTVVEVVLRGDRSPEKRTKKAKDWWWVNNSASSITHYRIITLAQPPEPEMAKTAQEHAAAMVAATKPEPDLIALRLECLKLALHHYDAWVPEKAADRFLDYVLNGSVDKT